MVAASRFGQPARRGERVAALLFVGLMHVGLAVALLSGFHVPTERLVESRLHLIQIEPVTPPPLPPPVLEPKKSHAPRESAPPSTSDLTAGAVTPPKAKVIAPVAPVPQVVMPVAPVTPGGGLSGQGSGAGGAGRGAGQSGNGTGLGDGDGDGNRDGAGGGGGSDAADGAAPRAYPGGCTDLGVLSSKLAGGRGACTGGGANSARTRSAFTTSPISSK
jgi:protein TonB